MAKSKPTTVAKSKPSTKPSAQPTAKPAPELEPADEQVGDATETELDIAGQIAATFDECDDEVQEGYRNTEQQGERFAPPDGTYLLRFVDNDQGACGSVRTRQPKDENDETKPYPIVILNMEIESAPDPALNTSTFDIPLFLKPYVDKQTGAKKVAGAGTLKTICAKAFDDEFDDMRVAINKVLTECGGSLWKVKVVRKGKAKDGRDPMPNYNFLEHVDEAQ